MFHLSKRPLTLPPEINDQVWTRDSIDSSLPGKACVESANCAIDPRSWSNGVLDFAGTTAASLLTVYVPSPGRR